MVALASVDVSGWSRSRPIRTSTATKWPPRICHRCRGCQQSTVRTTLSSRATRATPPPNTNKRRVRASMDMRRARAHHTAPHSRQQHAATAPQSVHIKSSNGAVRTRRKDSSSPGSSESCLRSVKVVGTFCAIVADGDGGWGSEDMAGWCGGACLTAADGQVQWLAGQQHLVAENSNVVDSDSVEQTNWRPKYQHSGEKIRREKLSGAQGSLL